MTNADGKDRCTVSFADAETGIFTGRVFRGTRRLLALNTPPGCIAVDGRHDPRTSRVDLATGQVVRFEAAPDHEAEARARRRRLKRRIASLEQRELRPLRELMIDPENAEARARLEALEAEIAALRSDLSNAGNQARSR